MLDNFLKVSPHGSFQIVRLCKSIAICEAVKGDKHDWGNATEEHPAFIAYLGCKKDEVAGYIKTLNIFYRCYWCEVRKPKYLKNFEAEIKIKEMQREADSYAWGLDYLVESEEAKHICCDYQDLKIWEYYIIFQSDELDPDTGVPNDTKEWIAPFLREQNEASLTKKYEGWIENGYHLATFDLRQVKVKLDGDNFYRPIWQAPWVGNEDEF
jgi:hypothetical protein